MATIQGCQVFYKLFNPLQQPNDTGIVIILFSLSLFFFFGEKTTSLQRLINLPV